MDISRHGFEKVPEGHIVNKGDFESRPQRKPAEDLPLGHIAAEGAKTFDVIDATRKIIIEAS